jgi:zinc-finger of transposase IS204/IS1001/IS1096/IS1165
VATCPECGAVSGRIHSRYRRRLIDLPAHGRIVEINVETRRFRCVGTGCRRRIFVQRLGDAVALPSARRTMRMDGIVHRLGLALGGRPGHNLASRLAIPVSKDTLLRTVRRRAARPRDPLRVTRRGRHATGGSGDNALKMIEKGRSRWGHDRRRLGPHPNTSSPICHKQLAPLVQAAWFGADFAAKLKSLNLMTGRRVRLKRSVVSVLARKQK